MIKWFINNFKPPYYEKMISVQVTHFTSLIPNGKRIDEGIMSKKIIAPEASSSMIEQQVKKVQPAQAFPQAFNQRGRLDQRRYPGGEPQKFSPLLMPMAEHYAYLLQKKLVTPMFAGQSDDPLLPSFDSFKKCEHHFRAKGHTLEEFSQLRNRV
ncbi:hypothetical protein SO802_002530 [Lithocarpus litseifolius]|uniref:Uncharacterized protein n=1 Tax=Lithocarpus litseifolius TaxID=425828 RepID=A0AAW2DYE9_9ROSI